MNDRLPFGSPFSSSTASRRFRRLLVLTVAVATLLLLAVGSGSAHSLTAVDGNDSDWLAGFGAAGCPSLPGANSASLYSTSNGCALPGGARGTEYIWTDTLGDQRTDHWSGTGNLDLTQFRMTATETHLNFLLRFSDITNCNAQYIAIAVNSGTGGTNFFPDNAETGLPFEYERVVEVNTNATGYWTNNTTFTSAGSSFCNDTANLWEIQMPLSGLGLTYPFASGQYDFAAAIFCRDTGGTICEASSSDAMDVITTVGGNTFNEVGDGTLNYSFTTALNDPVDVQITKSGPSSADLGAQVEYTLTFVNNGPGTATGVVVTDAIPSQLTNVSYTVFSQSDPATTVTVRPSTRYIWDVSNLGIGDSVTIKVTGTLDSNAALTSFDNTATIATTASDFNTDNNSSTTTLTPTDPVQPGPTFTVNSTADTDDGQCTLRDCTLREAINAANARTNTDNGGTAAVDPDQIHFNIPGSDVQTITPGSSLPSVTGSVVIDGTTQPGASCAAWPPTLRVQVSGSSLTANSTALLTLSASNSTVRGLVLNGTGFPGAALGVLGSGNRIECNFIGTNAAGTASANAGAGVRIAGASNNVIGTNGDDAGDATERNLISGNGRFGVNIFANTSSNNRVAGNYIGTNATGTSALPNGVGVFISDSAYNNIIGGDLSAEQNVIAYSSDGGGVYMMPSAGTGNRIQRNAIHDNSEQGIDFLVNYGPTANDAGDPDTGPNNLQNYPTFTALINLSGQLVVSYAVDSSTSNSTYPLTVEFFEADSAASGEGETFLGDNSYNETPGTQKTVTLGNAATLGVADGDPLVATATDANGNTSEFSAVVAVVADVVQAGPTFTVNTTDDANDGNCTTVHCSLREAINAANTRTNTNNDATSGADPDAIHFNIPGSGVQTITPASSLPSVTGAVVIDGTTQPNASCAAWPPTLLVQLNGSSLSTGNLLDITGGNSTVRGLVLNRADRAINLASSGNRVECSYIGTNAAGTSALANHYGVYITSAAQNNIVGTNGDGTNDALERNLISGNNGLNDVGVRVDGNQNRVAGNYMGINAAGTSALANRYGLYILGNQNIFGTNGDGTGDGAERNIISGSTTGISIRSAANNNRVAGNYIGTDATGANALGNTNGVEVSTGSTQNIIGTNGDGSGDAAERNVISGNLYGITLSSSADANWIAGNYIGTNAAATGALPNATGVDVVGTAQNVIGTNADGNNDEAERNVISGNTNTGLNLWSGANNNRIVGNYIGTNPGGTSALSNGIGVNISNGTQNIIGTNGDGNGDAAERNVISGNSDYGVAIGGTNLGGANNRVAGNYIGTNATGTSALANGTGVVITIDQNVIGTNGDGNGDEAERNLISGNGTGVHIFGSLTHSNRVAGNYIGTNAAGTSAVANSMGVQIDNSAANNIVGTNGDGTADAAEGNLISGNSGNGVMISGTGTNTNRVAGNTIGTDAAGTSALPNSVGVLVEGSASSNIIGTNSSDTDPAQTGDEAEGNLISGNTTEGVWLIDSDNNRVAGNRIGTNADGTAALVNSYGVLIQGGASSNIIGTDGDGTADEAERNLISGNTEGVWITGANSDNNRVAGNTIGTNAAGTSALPNGTGVTIELGASDNIIAANLISGNSANGVQITGANSDNNWLAGNTIGTDAAGDSALPNSTGVVIQNGASNNLVGTNSDGTADEAEDNLISGNSDTGIRIAGSDTDNNRVAGNSIGTDAAGTSALANVTGVYVGSDANSNIIGTNGDGTRDSGEGNLISGNTDGGIHLSGTISTTVAGNIVGLDVTGAVLSNTVGILVDDTMSSTIGTNGDGTSDAFEGNVIGGNGSYGVQLAGGSEGNTIAGNLIGVVRATVTPAFRAGGSLNAGSPSAVTPASYDARGNGGDGIFISAEGDPSTNNLIGGNLPVEQNVIASNGSDGVAIVVGTGNRVQRNAMFNNSEEGIDLGDNGPTPNDDPGDLDGSPPPDVLGGTDESPNHLQNYPTMITAIISSSGELVVTYSVNSFDSDDPVSPAPASAYPLTIEFFEADSALSGEGRTFLAEDTYTTRLALKIYNLGNAAALGVAGGDPLVGTATDAEGNTSEFSVPVTVAAPAAAQLAGFTATQEGEQVLLQWETVSEQGNVGFNLYRSTSPDSEGERLNAALIASEAPNSSEGFAYQWVDNDVEVGTTYYYWLEAVDLNGTTSRFGPASVEVNTPTALTLDTFAAGRGAGRGTSALAALGLAGLLALLHARRARAT